MPDLSRDLRGALKTTINAARDAAETGAADALRGIGVFDSRRPGHLDDARNETRKRLRAHAKSLGDDLNAADGEPLRRLVEAAAYVQWHRLLFARFLVERGLLRDATGVAVSLTDCAEEAVMEGSGDEWSVAAAYSARMLPGVFPADDPVEALALAPEHAKTLRGHLLRLDAATFQADDSLGWTYQFWRVAEKERVNKSGVKIGAAELPAVTQLFTEPYMVRFLLHNTLGAWWAGKVLAMRPELVCEAPDEGALRVACALPGYAWDFLRFVRENDVWRPAAGVFPGWPVTAAALTVLDPCCGSGHFLTEALAALAALRGAEEGLPPAEAVVAVLRDNLAGLEIDGRCVQIAAFALAVTAWRIGGAGVALPTPHVAWVGGPPPLPRAEFAALANGDAELRRGLEALHDLFVQAPTLGSLIEPVGGDLVDPVRVARIESSIDILLGRIRGAEPGRFEGVLAARGMADAAAILANKFVLQVTNVPFLGRGRQNKVLMAYLARRFDIAKSDLATVMLERMRVMCAPGGTIAAVTPQTWLFLGSYKKLREALLAQTTWLFIGALGTRCFETISGEVVNATLIALSSLRPEAGSEFAGLDANEASDPRGKSEVLRSGNIQIASQTSQKNNPDARITFDPSSNVNLRLSRYAECYQGLRTGDRDRFVFSLWEIVNFKNVWVPLRNSSDKSDPFHGISEAVRWGKGTGELHTYAAETRDKLHDMHESGNRAWGKIGVAINQMGGLKASLYFGEHFDGNVNVVIPRTPDDLPAIFSYCESEKYGEDVRELDKKMAVTNATLIKVPFDLAHWQKIAAERYPNGLPEPYSDDPTQWLFHGHPRHAAQGTELHVALARLAGYRWPAETDPAMRLSTEAHARIAQATTLPPPDPDGLLALVPALGERPLADRLRAFCVTAWGDAWTTNTEAALVAAACEKAKDKPPRTLTIDAWLRTHAARQHAKLFHERPFLWWITDGRADGFTAVAHYHRLTKGNLERLTYTVLGDWITRLGDDPRNEAARVLQAKLARILEGEVPFDIFARWKPLHAQPQGWDPDLDDGVRQNIRPFIEANVLGFAPKILKDVDRGKDVSSAPWFHRFDGERRNDHHTTLLEKREARAEQTKEPDDQVDDRDFKIPPLPARTIDPANAAALIRPIIRSLLRDGGGDGRSGSWLRQNETLVRTALDAGGDTSPATRAANSFLQWLGPRLLHEPQQKELLSPLTAVSPLPLEQAEPLYDALRIAAEVSLTDPGSMVEGVSNRLRLLPPERRVAIGVARHRGEEVPLLLFTVANAVANQLSRDADQRIQQRVVGLASAQISGPVIPPSVPADEHRPGRSVAHFAGTAGSLGAYVEWADAKTGRKVLGFLGASHVLARSGQADPGDHIHSPGVPDADNNIAWRYGRLANARALVHAEDTTAEGAYVNDCDIAVARLTKACHPQNRVPGLDPNEGLNPVIRAVSDDELSAFSDDVFLIGRTSPTSRGRFFGSHIREFATAMPDGREYLFGNVAAIESADPSVPFSRPGDSGGIVYGFLDGACVALGFVIGAFEGMTYISPAARCLKTMGVELLGD